jgi:hypothetical protein
MAARQLIVQRLLLSEQEQRSSIDVLKSIDWHQVPAILRALGREVSPHDTETIISTDVDSIRSCIATRQALSGIGDRSRGVVPALCAEIVGWFGARLSLTDVAAQYTQQQRSSGKWWLK